MIVFCAGMVRSGSTLQYNLAREIVEAVGVGWGEGYIDPGELSLVRQRLSEWARDPKLHVVKVHTLPRAFPRLAASGGTKVLYIYRDLYSVASSVKRVWGKEGDDLLQLLHAQVVVYRRVRRTPAPVLFQRYEKVSSDLLGMVTEIAGFLGVEGGSKEWIRIAQRWGRRQVRRKVAEYERTWRCRILMTKIPVLKVAGWLRLPDPLLVRIRRSLEPHQPRTLLHPSHVSREGETGPELTESERVAIRNRYGELVDDPL